MAKTHIPTPIDDIPEIVEDLLTSAKREAARFAQEDELCATDIRSMLNMIKCLTETYMTFRGLKDDIRKDIAAHITPNWNIYSKSNVCEASKGDASSLRLDKV